MEIKNIIENYRSIAVCDFKTFITTTISNSNPDGAKVEFAVSNAVSDTLYKGYFYTPAAASGLTPNLIIDFANKGIFNAKIDIAKSDADNANDIAELFYDFVNKHFTVPDLWMVNIKYLALDVNHDIE